MVIINADTAKKHTAELRAKRVTTFMAYFNAYVLEQIMIGEAQAYFNLSGYDIDIQYDILHEIENLGYAVDWCPEYSELEVIWKEKDKEENGPEVS